MKTRTWTGRLCDFAVGFVLATVLAGGVVVGQGRRAAVGKPAVPAKWHHCWVTVPGGGPGNHWTVTAIDFPGDGSCVFTDERGRIMRVQGDYVIDIVP